MHHHHPCKTPTVVIGALGLLLANAAYADSKPVAQQIAEDADLDPSGPPAITPPDQRFLDELEVGDKVIIRAPEMTWNIGAHAAGEIRDLDGEDVTIKVETERTTSNVQTQLGQLMRDIDRGDELTAPRDLVRPYTEDFHDRFRVKENYTFEAIATSQRAPDIYHDSNRFVRAYIDRTMREIQRSDYSLESMPEIEAGLDFRERLVDHVADNGGYASVGEAIEDDPTIVARIGFETLDDHGYMDYARSLFDADEVLLPWDERSIDEVRWGMEPHDIDYAALAAPTIVNYVLGLSHQELAYEIETNPEAAEDHRALAGLMVDYLDGAQQEGTREEQIEALIELTRSRLENL